jgi:hypothetical protein
MHLELVLVETLKTESLESQGFLKHIRPLAWEITKFTLGC